MNFLTDFLYSWDFSGLSLSISLKHAFYAACLAVTLMTFVMKIFNYLKIAEADMIRALGSLITKKVENSFFLGLFIQVMMGTFFALIYGFLFQLLPEKFFLNIPAIGAGFGLFHGGVVSWAIASIISDYHPVKRFQEAQLEEVIAHTVGHVIFGLTIGISYLWILPVSTQGFTYLFIENSRYFTIMLILLVIFTSIAYTVHLDRLKKD